MSTIIEKVNLVKLAQSLGDREEKTASTLEGMNVYVTSYVGEYAAHKHPKAEFFFVLDGELELEFREQVVILGKGEGLKVPEETVHKPSAKARALVMKIEPVDFPFEKV